ncbi:MAG TPA: PDZ domain-containing protein [Pengzhenrongella sp.]
MPDPLSGPDADPDVDVQAGPETAADPPPVPSPRSVTLSVASLVTLVLFAVLVLVPAPYAIGAPGPTRDTLGEQNGTPLIDIGSKPSYPTTGELRLTTVSFSGGPGYPVTLPDVLRGWLSGSSVVSPVETVFPSGRSQDEIAKENSAEMISSQENATVAALEELGYTVPARLGVAGVVDGTGAVGVVRKGDVVVALDGKPVVTYTDLVDALAKIEPSRRVSLGIERDGTRRDVEIVTGARPGGGSQLGVLIDPVFDLPVHVTIKIDDIGGPSAGTMFALGIIDKLTPEDEANGVVIAGTGTMDVNGKVGRIGGIQQKLAGAWRDGAAWFIAPAGDCDEVVGHVPGRLRVVKVETLHDARAAMEAIGSGRGASLPTCP